MCSAGRPSGFALQSFGGVRHAMNDELCRKMRRWRCQIAFYPSIFLGGEERFQKRESQPLDAKYYLVDRLSSWEPVFGGWPQHCSAGRYKAVYDENVANIEDFPGAFQR